MSIQSQVKNMKMLAELLNRDLGYIPGPRESGPNGAKKDFLSKGRAFMRALAHDLELAEKKVTVNPAGIAVSGDVSLCGSWGGGNKIYIVLEQLPFSEAVILYREDNGIGLEQNHFIDRRWLARGDYSSLVEKLLQMRKTGACYERAA